MNKRLSLQHSFDLIAAIIAAMSFLGVLQTFIIGKHFIIPTMILFVGVLFGNLAYYGYQGCAWAKQILFWMFFIFTWHALFALFWAKKYREVFGDSFEYVFGSVVIVFGFLLFKYVAANKILNLKRGQDH